MTAFPVRPLSILIAAGTLLAASNVMAQNLPPADPFYKGRTINITTPSAVGSSYDFYGRVLSRHMPKYIAGTPTMVVQNMPGGGGMLQTNSLYNVAPKDGSLFGVMNQTVSLEQVLGEGAKYDIGKFSWIGRLKASTGLVMVYETSPAKSMEDMKTVETVFGSNGKASQATMIPTLLRTVLGYKTKVILGYPGASDIFLAMERGEVQGRTGAIETITTSRPQWLTEKKVIMLTELSLEKEPTFPGIKLMRDLTDDPEKKAILDYVGSYTVFGATFAAPPAIPANRLEILRRAFDATMKDKDFLDEIEKNKIGYSPETGEYVQKIAENFSAASPELIAKVKKALEY
jgi:hypothetical protein